MKQTSCLEEKKKAQGNDIEIKSFCHIDNMPKGTYLVDMDGVLFDYTRHLMHIWNAKHPEFTFNHKEQTEFYTEDYLPIKYNKMSKDYFKLRLEKIVDTDPDFFASLVPIEGALEGILKLAEKNPVYICTAPNVKNDYCASGKIQSIRKYLGEEWVRKTIIVKDKTLIKGDFLIDDKPEIVGSFEKSWTHILFDQLYNKNIETNYRFTWTKGLF